MIDYLTIEDLVEVARRVVDGDAAGGWRRELDTTDIPSGRNVRGVEFTAPQVRGDALRQVLMSLWVRSGEGLSLSPAREADSGRSPVGIVPARPNCALHNQARKGSWILSRELS